MFALPLLLAVSSQMPFADDLDELDLRCVAISSAALANAPAAQRPLITNGLLYFIGRIDGRAPSYDLEANLRRAIPTITDAVAKAEGQRCDAILEERGRYLQKVGGALQGSPAK